MTFPNTPLPVEELQGQLGDSALSLVKELNTLATVVNENSAAIVANISGDSSLAELVSANDQALEQKIDVASGDAATALVNESDRLQRKITEETEESRTEARDLSNSVLEQSLLTANQVAVDVNANLDAAVKQLNDRIGVETEVVTTDATPTSILTVTPSSRVATRFSGSLVAMRDIHTEVSSYLFSLIANALASSEILTVAAGNAADGDQVEIDGVTYTFRAVPAVAFDVDIGVDAETTIDNFVLAIDDAGTPGTEYGVGTAKHATFTARKNSASTMIVAARQPGVAADGSSVTDPVDGGGTLSWGAAVTSGGSDMDVNGGFTDEYETAPGDYTPAVAASGADVVWSVTGAANKKITWRLKVDKVEIITFV
jgi:hypothetical protein